MTEPTEIDPEFAQQIADATESFLTSLQAISRETHAGAVVPFLLLEVSQVLLAGARLGAQHDFVVDQEWQPDVGPEADTDELRLRLAELDSDKARFLRHVSHELKTPLAALREGVSLLEDGVTGALNPNQAQVVQILQQNTAALQRHLGMY